MLSPHAYFEVLKTTLAHTSKTTPDDVATLQSQYSRQLWHEFSTGLLHALAHDPLVRLASYDVHEVLVVPVRANLDGSVYVRLLFHACTALVSDDSGSGDKLTSLLDSAMASLSTNGHEQCVNAVHCLKALVLMAHGPSLEAKALIDKVTDYVTTVAVHELLPVLQAFLHRARLRQAELLCNYTDFYGNAFAVARYGAAAGIPLVEEELSAVAYKAATAALLAPDVYNFGDFLTNASFVSALENSPNQWALELLRLCSNGVVERFDRFMTENGASLAADLQQAVRSGRLGNKVRLMALLHLIFITPAHERTIPFSTIAQKCSVSEDEVERVVLAAMAQRLVEGSIDEVAQTVQVTWSQPRVMDLAEIGALADSIASWRKAVREAADQVGKLAATINK